jgi:hypothetical protein
VGLIWNHQSWDTLWKTYKKPWKITKITMFHR